MILSYSLSNLPLNLAGCPRVLRADRVFCDPLLLCDIEELRSMSKQNVGTDVVEDFTELDEDNGEDD